MTVIFETQTFLVDPFGSPITNVNLDKNFFVLAVSILTNTVRPNGVREITLALVYEDSSALEHSISIQTILMGQNIPAVTDVVLLDIETIRFTKFLNHSIVNDTMRVSIITISFVGAAVVNNYSVEKNQLDPANPITVGTPVLALADYVDSHIVNLGSLTSSKNNNVNQGTINSAMILLTESV